MGAPGIGFTISKGLAAAGARVVVVDVDPTRGSDALAALQTPGQECMFVAADVSAATDVDQMVSRVLDAFGKIDFLVNNVGIWYRHAFWDITDDEWDRVVAVNLRGTYLCTQRVSRAMAAGGGGSIVSIASQAGVSYSKGQGAHYHATKAAIIHLTRILAFELADANIRINCVSPGGTPKVVDEPEQTAAVPLSPGARGSHSGADPVGSDGADRRTLPRPASFSFPTGPATSRDRTCWSTAAR